MKDVPSHITGRIRLLADRDAAPLPQIVDEVAAFSARVDGHLKKMGVPVYFQEPSSLKYSRDVTQYGFGDTINKLD